jgi:predicted nucleic acid-binding protein
MFLDTDVLIWGLKQDANAVQLLDSLEDIRLSAVVYMELLQGARNKQELATIIKEIQAIGAVIVPINEAITNKAIELVQQFAHSHSLYLADALIAATAIHHAQLLITANDKHYAAIPELSLDIFRPVR